MTLPSSFSVSGLLGANSIDTTALISQLVQAAAIPQTQLKNQLSAQTAMLTAYQAINTKTTAMQTAAQALTDPTAWTATAASSSNPAVVATSSGSATVGSTTISVKQVATAQLSTVAADGSGNVVDAANLVTGVTIGGHTVGNLKSGSATDVAAAINAANIGVRASVVTTDAGTLLQLASTSTGTANAFASSGFLVSAQDVVTAQNAQIAVGDPLTTGYTVTRPTNTFTDVIAGVTFSVSAQVDNVTITVAADQKSVADKVKALVDSANVVLGEISMDTAKGAILQGSFESHMLASDVMSAVSKGAAGGKSLKGYGIDMDKNGVLSFNATTFTQAYAADPAGTKAAIATAFAKNLDTAATTAIAPVTGSITVSIAAVNRMTTDLNKRIDAWTARLALTQANLQAKFTNMNSMLATLQSQSSYLTNMLKSANSSNNSSSS